MIDVSLLNPDLYEQIPHLNTSQVCDRHLNTCQVYARRLLR